MTREYCTLKKKKNSLLCLYTLVMLFYCSGVVVVLVLAMMDTSPSNPGLPKNITFAWLQCGRSRGKIRHVLIRDNNKKILFDFMHLDSIFINPRAFACYFTWPVSPSFCTLTLHLHIRLVHQLALACCFKMTFRAEWGGNEIQIMKSKQLACVQH